MALVNPRDFTDLCGWTDPRLRLRHVQQLTAQRGGRVQAKDLGPSLWTASWQSVALDNNTAEAVLAEFRSLRGAVHPFTLYPALRPAPHLTTDGLLDGATPQVLNIRADNSAIALTQLPVGTVFSAGDFVSIATAGGGTEFLQLVSGATVVSGGDTPFLEVVPFVRSTIEIGNAVTLVKPPVVMRLEPETLDDPVVGLSHRRITFSATQVLQ